MMSKAIESLSLFSTNDQAEELPTISLRYLLVPAYFAYILQEINVEIGKRCIYLNSAKVIINHFFFSINYKIF